MRIWSLYAFGREILRTEVHEDADKTIVEAVREMIEDDYDEASYEDDSDLRIAGEDEHLVFTPEDIEAMKYDD